jgi:hypothetical protein
MFEGLTGIALVLAGVWVIAHLWSAGADVVVESTMAEQATRAKTRELKAEANSLISTNKALKKVDDLDEVINPTDALKRLKKLSRTNRDKVATQS